MASWSLLPSSCRTSLGCSVSLPPTFQLLYVFFDSRLSDFWYALCCKVSKTNHAAFLTTCLPQTKVVQDWAQCKHLTLPAVGRVQHSRVSLCTPTKRGVQQEYDDWTNFGWSFYIPNHHNKGILYHCLGSVSSVSLSSWFLGEPEGYAESLAH